MTKATMNEFLAKLAETLELDSVLPDSVLADIEEWDSLSALSVIAMIDAEYGVNLPAADLKEVGTAKELYELVQKKAGK